MAFGGREAQREIALLILGHDDARLDQLDPGRRDTAGEHGLGAELDGGQRRQRKRVAIGLVDPNVLEAKLDAALIGEANDGVLDIDRYARQLGLERTLDRRHQEADRDRPLQETEIDEADGQHD
jgi:hypothetical protein